MTGCPKLSDRLSYAQLQGALSSEKGCPRLSSLTGCPKLSATVSQTQCQGVLNSVTCEKPYLIVGLMLSQCRQRPASIKPTAASQHVTFT